jgi:hypothetical protein
MSFITGSIQLRPLGPWAAAFKLTESTRRSTWHALWEAQSAGRDFSLSGLVSDDINHSGKPWHQSFFLDNTTTKSPSTGGFGICHCVAPGPASPAGCTVPVDGLKNVAS